MNDALQLREVSTWKFQLLDFFLKKNSLHITNNYMKAVWIQTNLETPCAEEKDN